MDLVNVRPEHLALLDVRKEQELEIKDLLAVPSYHLDNFIRSTVYNKSMFYNGELVMIVYVGQVTPSTIELCMLVGENVKKVPLRKMLRVIKEEFEKVKKLTTVRIQSTVIADFKAGNRFATALGFKKEGTLRQFNYGKDFTMYGLIKGED